jgi:GYF domain 2
MWFYFHNGQRLGPVTLDALVRALLAAPDPRGVLVWREGMAEWQEAGRVPELASRLPPPMFVAPGGHPPESVPFEDAEKLAQLYRRLVLLVGLQILVGLFLVPFQAQPTATGGLVGGVANLVVLVVAVVGVVTAYKLAGLLRSGPPLLWAIAMLLPCINIIVLLVLSSQAQTWCRRYGIKVGFLGPTQESIEEVRRLAMTRPFE